MNKINQGLLEFSNFSSPWIDLSIILNSSSTLEDEQRYET